MFQLQGQAVHTGTGFPLRRFNIDISDGEYPTTALSDAVAKEKLWGHRNCLYSSHSHTPSLPLLLTAGPPSRQSISPPLSPTSFSPHPHPDFLHFSAKILFLPHRKVHHRNRKIRLTSRSGKSKPSIRKQAVECAFEGM